MKSHQDLSHVAEYRMYAQHLGWQKKAGYEAGQQPASFFEAGLSGHRFFTGALLACR